MTDSYIFLLYLKLSPWPVYSDRAQLLFIYLKRILSGSDLYMSEYKSSTWDYSIWGVSDFMEVAILKCSSYDPLLPV